MNEYTPSNERGAEKIPNEREVLNQLESIIGNDFEIVRSLEDERGLYLLEVDTKDAAGDLIKYSYHRAGEFKEATSKATAIDVLFYMGDIPFGGNTLATYVDGTWVPE